MTATKSDEAAALALLQRCRLEYQTVKDDYTAVKRGVTLRHVDQAWARMNDAEQDYNRILHVETEPQQPEARPLTCDMVEGCASPVTHVDHKGYAYCTVHGTKRRLSGIPTRKLRSSEIKRLKAGGTIRYR